MEARLPIVSGAGLVNPHSLSSNILRIRANTSNGKEPCRNPCGKQKVTGFHGRTRLHLGAGAFQKLWTGQRAADPVRLGA